MTGFNPAEPEQQDGRFSGYFMSMTEVEWLLDQVSDAIITTDADFRITSWNGAAEKIYGWTAGETADRPMHELLGTQWLHASREAADAALLDTRQWQGTLQQTARDGSSITVEAVVSWMLDERGEPIGCVTVNRDVTQRKAYEKALSESEERHRSIVSALPDILFRVDADGRFTDVRTSKPEQLLVPMDQIVGRAVSELLPPPVAEATIKHCRMTIETGSMQEYHYQLDVRGESREFEVRMVPCGDREALAIVRDVTERKALQRRLLKSSEREQRRLAQELHDGLCQELKGLEIQAALLEDLTRHGDASVTFLAASLGRQVNGAVHKAYAIARGMMPIELDAGSFPAALMELARQIKEQADISVNLEIQKGLVPLDERHALQLYRIAQEALNNVVRHANADEVVLGWQGGKEASALFVRDNGKGLVADVEAEANKGMGFTIMRSRAESLGALLAVRTLSGGGTEVKVSISKGRLVQSENPGWQHGKNQNIDC